MEASLVPVVDVLFRLLPFPSLVVADLGFPDSWVLGVSFRFRLASSTPATRIPEFFVHGESSGIVRNWMELVSYYGWNNDNDVEEGWQHSPKKSADPRGIFPGLFRHDEYI